MAGIVVRFVPTANPTCAIPPVEMARHFGWRESSTGHLAPGYFFNLLTQGHPATSEEGPIQGQLTVPASPSNLSLIVSTFNNYVGPPTTVTDYDTSSTVENQTPVSVL